jgi:hypothetical protein
MNYIKTNSWAVITNQWLIYFNAFCKFTITYYDGNNNNRTPFSQIQRKNNYYIFLNLRNSFFFIVLESNILGPLVALPENEQCDLW